MTKTPAEKATEALRIAQKQFDTAKRNKERLEQQFTDATATFARASARLDHAKQDPDLPTDDEDSPSLQVPGRPDEDDNLV